MKEINCVRQEPYELLTVDVEDTHQGAVMEELGRRRGDLQDMQADGKGRTRLEYRIPARGLIGFQGEFLTMTRGTGLASHIFDDYGPVKGDMDERRNGVLISQDDGAAVAYALWKLQDRGRMFVSPGEALYEGMIIGIHSRDNDLVVNPIKGKQLTNVRASGTDEAVRLVPPMELTPADHEGGGWCEVWTVKGGKLVQTKKWFQGYRPVIQKHLAAEASKS